MLALVDRSRLLEFMRRLGQSATSPGLVYFTGGASAVLLDWRASTIDIDYKMDPEQDAIYRAIPDLKEQLDINVELALPPGRRRPGRPEAGAPGRSVFEGGAAEVDEAKLRPRGST